MPVPEGKVRVLEEPPHCPGCEITLEEEVILGGPSDPSSIRDDAEGRQCMVGHLSSGHFVVTGPVGGGRLFLYDEQGQLAGTIGRPGSGPGEFRADMRVVIGPADTLYVMDDHHGRIQVFDPDGRFVRSFPAPSTHRGFGRLVNGDFLFGLAPGASTEALFQVTNEEGKPTVRSGVPVMSDPGLETWIVSPSGSGGFWAANSLRYELYRWDSSGSVTEVLVRAVDWFPPFPVDGRYPTREARAQGRYPPLIGHLQEGEKGRLWVYAWVRARSWEPGVPARPQYEWARRTFDTILEVIDTGRGEVLARMRFDGRLAPVCGGPLLYTIREDDEGYPRIQILRPTLHLNGLER
jgi:hypothetical protein